MACVVGSWYASCAELLETPVRWSVEREETSKEGGFSGSWEARDAEERASTLGCWSRRFCGQVCKWWITRGLESLTPVYNLWTTVRLAGVSCDTSNWVKACGGRRSGVGSPYA